MVLIRDLSKLSSVMILATLCMLSTIAVVMFYGSINLISSGVKPEVELIIKPDTCLVFIGMCSFLYGKVGLVIPMREIMQKKAEFNSCLYASMWTIFGIFAIFGMVGYLAFGRDPAMVNGGGMVTLALNQGNAIVQGTELAFILSLIPSFALMIYVPIKIWEKAFYGTWSRSCARTWWKNLWRMLAVGLICYLAIATGKIFDKVMAIFGSLFGGPTTYLWPAIFHLVLATKDWKQKLMNYFLIAFGTAASGFTLYISIKKMISP